jgi:hypothetical protein
VDGAQSLTRCLILGGEREILFEFVVQGSVVKVTAIDAASGEEASIIGPAGAARAPLQAAALQKLRYVQKKQRG